MRPGQGNIPYAQSKYRTRAFNRRTYTTSPANATPAYVVKEDRPRIDGKFITGEELDRLLDHAAIDLDPYLSK